MTTPHKAMLIQALKALKNSIAIRNNEGGTTYGPSLEIPAIAALQAAIDAPEPKPVAWMNNKRDMTYFGHYNKDDLPLFAAAGAAPVPSELVLTFNFGTLVKVVFQDRVLYEVDLSPKPYFQVCWAHGWAGDYESEEEAREECLSLCGHGRSIREIKPGDDGYKNPRQPQLTEKRFLLTAAGAAPVPEDWRSAVAMAYGHLWHINNEPMAPIPLRSEESASYAARKLLRDLLTTEERGEAINSVRAMLTAAPKEPT